MTFSYLCPYWAWTPREPNTGDGTRLPVSSALAHTCVVKRKSTTSPRILAYALETANERHANRTALTSAYWPPSTGTAPRAP